MGTVIAAKIISNSVSWPPGNHLGALLQRSNEAERVRGPSWVAGNYFVHDSHLERWRGEDAPLLPIPQKTPARICTSLSH